MGNHPLGFERSHNVEFTLLRKGCPRRRSLRGLGGVGHILVGIFLFQVALRPEIVFVRDKPCRISLVEQLRFEFEAFPGFLVFVLFAPLGHTLRQKFLTAQPLGVLGLFNLHDIAVVFLAVFGVGVAHFLKVLNLNLEKALLQCLLVSVEGIAGSGGVHLRLYLLGGLLAAAFLHRHGSVLFQPPGLKLRFLFQQFLIVFVLLKIVVLEDTEAVVAVFDFEVVLVEKELRPRFQPCRIVADILRGTGLPFAFGVVKLLFELLSRLNCRAAFLCLARLAVFFRFIGSKIIESKVRVASHRVVGRCFKHRQPGTGFIEKFAHLVCGDTPRCRVRFVDAYDYGAALSTLGVALEVGYEPAKFRGRISGERIGFTLNPVYFPHSGGIFAVGAYHIVNDIDGVRRPAPLVLQAALYSLQLTDNILTDSAGGLQVNYDAVSYAHGVLVRLAVGDKLLLQLLRKAAESIVESFLCSIFRALYGAFLSGDARRSREPFVSGCKVCNLVALVY